MNIRTKPVLIIIALIFIALGQLALPILIYVGIACIVLFMGISKRFENYKVCLMLIPMIRIFDITGITFFVNILLSLPLFIYLIKEKSISQKALLHTGLLMIIELIHAIALNNLENIPSNLSAILPLMYCETILEKDNKDLEPLSIARWLSIGVIFSASVYMFGHISYFNNIIQAVISGVRFKAYADDPNYYSLYIVMAIIGILSGKDHKIFDYLFLLVLVTIGLLTTSKMCTIMMIITFIIYGGNYVISKAPEKRNFIRRILIISVAAIIVFRNTINQLLNHIIKRLSGRNSIVSIGSITTGRSQIAIDYIIALLKDPVAMLFGYGFQYRRHFEVTLGNRDYYSIAHNTFLDVVLSWGIIGFIVVTLIVYGMVHRAWRRGNSTFITWYPFVSLLVMFMALSCLSAGMFWYIITLPLLIAKNNNCELETTENESR